MKWMSFLLAAWLLLPVTGSSQQSGECIDTDGDGWGWNKDLRQSCIPPGSTDRQDPVGIKISWPDNPQAENVDGYVLRLQVNSVSAAEETTDGTSLNFKFDVINATFGDEICVQVAAYRSTVTSDFSELNCLTVPDQVLPPVSVPGLPSMVWLY